MVIKYLGLFLISLFLSCSKPDPMVLAQGPALNATALNRLIITASDYQTGDIRALELNTGRISAKKIPIHSDAIARYSPGTPFFYVVNRLGQDNIQVVDLKLNQMVSQKWAYRGSNPQDIYILNPERAVVTLLDKPELLEINPQTGATLYRSTLREYPHNNSGRIIGIGSNLWIQSLRLKDYDPTDYSSIVVWSPFEHKIVNEIRLERTNPVADIKLGPDKKVYVAEAGFTGLKSKLDGGIEKINPDTFTSEGLVIEESQLDGDIVDFEIFENNNAIVLVSGKKDRLIRFDPSQKHVLDIITEAEPNRFSQIIRDITRDQFYLSVRKPKPLIRTFDVKSGKEKMGTQWEIGFPPYHAFMAP